MTVTLIVRLNVNKTSKEKVITFEVITFLY